MPESPADFGSVHRISAQSFGEPGKRTFRIWAAVPGRSASLWLEKEQLIALAAAIEELLESAPPGSDEEPAPDADLPAEDADAEIDMHVGSLALGYDQRAGLLRIYVSPVGALRSDPPAFACALTRAQLRGVVAQISDILARGRPICPLCHEPIDPGGHVCVRGNGHTGQEIPPRGELEEGEEEGD